VQETRFSTKAFRYVTNRFVAVLIPVWFSLLANSEGLAGQAEGEKELGEVRIVATPLVEGTETDRFANEKTVVTASQIGGLNAYDLPSALRTSPGVTITRYNVVGSFGGAEGGAVFLRGLGSSRPGAEIQTTIEGVPVGNAIWHHPLLDLVPLTPVGAIEIRKSSQPLQFGNAFGVVNVLPRRRLEEGVETEVSAMYGSFDTIMETARHAGKKGKFDYAVTQAYRRSDGHRDDADGHLGDFSLRLGYELNETWEAGFFTMYSESFARDPGPRYNEALKDGTYETNQCVAIVSLANRFEQGHGSVKVYWSRGEGDWRDQAGNACNTLNEWLTYGVLARQALELWEGGQILVGADADVVDGDARFTYDDATPPRHFLAPQFVLLSPFCGLSQRIELSEDLSITPSGGFRYYDHTYFAGEWSPQAGVVITWRNFEAHGSYSRGVSYPGLNVVVFSEDVIPALATSWRDLDAETVDHYELGIKHKWGKTLEIGATFFHDEVEDRYVFIPPPPPPPVFVNEGRFRTTGVECTAQVVPFSDLSLFASMTYLKPRPNDVPYTPRWSASGGARWRIMENVTLNVDAQYLDDMIVGSRARRSGASNTSKVGTYFLLNAKVSYRVPMGPVEGELFVAGENLTDTDYEYRPGYPMPGISVFGGMSVRF